MAMDTDTSMLNRRFFRSRQAPRKKGAQLYNTTGVVISRAAQRRVTAISGVMSWLKPSHSAMVAIITCMNISPARPRRRRYWRFSRAICSLALSGS